MFLPLQVDEPFIYSCTCLFDVNSDIEDSIICLSCINLFIWGDNAQRSRMNLKFPDSSPGFSQCVIRKDKFLSYCLSVEMLFCTYAWDTGRVEDQTRQSRIRKFICTISDLVEHIYMCVCVCVYIVNWNYKNYMKKYYNSVRLWTRGQNDNTYNLYPPVLQFPVKYSSNFTSSNNRSSDLSLYSLQYFSRPFYITFTQWRHVFSRNYVKHSARNADCIQWYSQM